MGLGSRTAWTALAVFALGGTAMPAVAEAQDAVATKAPKEQAKEWFALGLERFERGDYEGAIKAYEEAFALYPVPMMTFNIAMSYVKLGQPVEAVAAMEKVLAAPGKLRPERIEQAQQTLAAQKALVAELKVSCNVDGAILRLDGREVGTLPMNEPVPVAQGRVILQATKEGYRAGYASLAAPGGQQVPVILDLAETTKRLAQLEVDTKLLDAEIYVDGQLVARTPLRSTIPVTPDTPHQIVMKRAGYQAVKESVTLTEGATGFVTLQALEDPNAVASGGGELVLTLVQDDASVIVDGQRREVASGVPLRLAAGRHVITGTRTGYDPLNLRLDVPAGGRTEAILDLIPTPETRAQLIGDAEFDVGLGWGLTIGGAVLAGAGTGVLIWGLGRRSSGAQKERDIEAGVAPYEACADMSAMDEELEFCGLERLDAGQQQDLGLGFAVGGALGLAAGVGTLVTGIVYLATGDDPDQYRLQLDDDVFALQLTPTFSAGPGQGTVGLSGRF